MSKAAFILAGFRLERSENDPNFIKYVDLLSAYGYDARIVDISWRRKVHSQYVSELIEFYNRYKSTDNLMIGNSFGAAAAFMAAPQLQPDRLLLCSLSPFFKEDIGRFPKRRALKRFGSRRLEDFNSYSARDLAKLINSQTDTTFFFGSKERQTVPYLVERVQDSHNDMPGSELVEIVGAGHRMREPEYFDGVAEWCKNSL